MEPKKNQFLRTLNNLVDSGRFIPGIYNYCDRWCERCTMSHKCLTYAHEKEMWVESNDPENKDFDIGKFWEQIKLSFEVALDMISEEAQNYAIDVDAITDEIEPETIVNPVEKLANCYGTSMGNWLQVNDEALQAKTRRLFCIDAGKEKASKLADAVEVVKWYCYYIEGKIYRAFYDLVPRLQEQDEDFDTLADNNGSAKAAIIAIERTIGALLIIYEAMKEQEDEILGFLSVLSKLKKQMLEAFPAAMEFKRPGFDDF